MTNKWKSKGSVAGDTIKHPPSKTVVVIDGDDIAYTAACTGRKQSIRVTNKKSGKSLCAKTRTEFWGRGNKIGGILAEINKKYNTNFTKDDFEVEDISTYEDISNTLHSAKKAVEACLDAQKTNNYLMYLGEGKSFREHVSTMKKYKGARDSSNKPDNLGEVRNYLIKKYRGILVRGIEADDAVVMGCYGKDMHIAIAKDKDNQAAPILSMNRLKLNEGVVYDGRQFGKIWLSGSKGQEDVKGYGFLFLIYQICYGDDIDCYHAHTWSDKRWGKKSCYNKIKDCTDERDALRTAIEIFKYLYPEPREYTTWRGNKVVADWYYCMNEMLQMARMHRWSGDILSLDMFLSQYEVEYG